MTQIKTVALLGGTGALGAPILKALIDSGKFTVTAVTRSGSKSTFPSSIKVVQADYSSIESLTSALKGQDAVVSAVGTEGLLGQSLVFDAAVAAGVKRFIPSEFGSDIDNSNVAALPAFGYKVATRKHIEEKVKAGAETTYTYVVNGAYLDWGLDTEFMISWKEGKPQIYDGGDQLFSATTLATVGQAVVGILNHYEETKNRSVLVQDVIVSQNSLLAVAKKILPEQTWEPIALSISDSLKTSFDGLAKGDYSMQVMYAFLIASLFGGEKYGQPFKKTDNELLGITEKGDGFVEDVFKKVVSGA